MYLVLDSNDIQNIFFQLALSYPVQDFDFLRVQSFAAVRYREDIFATGLNKTKIYESVSANRGLYFNRRWRAENHDINDMRFDFPLSFLIQLETLPSDHIRPTYKFLFGILDLKSRDKGVDARVFERKINDLQLMVSSVLNELLNFVYASIDGGTHQWISENELKAKKADGEISSYSIRGWFKASFKNQNGLSFRTFEDENKGMKLHGVTCELIIQGDLKPKDYNY